MHFINRLNQQRNDRPLPTGSGHGAYDRTTPPEPWQVGWQCPPIDPNSPGAQERVAAYIITHHWKPIEEKASEDLG